MKLIKALNKLKPSFSFLSLLADILRLKDWKDDLRQGILVDLYFYTVQYPFITLKR